MQGDPAQAPRHSCPRGPFPLLSIAGCFGFPVCNVYHTQYNAASEQQNEV